MKLTLDDLRVLRIALREAAGWEAQVAQANRPAFREPDAEARKAARAAEQVCRRMMSLHRRVCDEITRAETRKPERWSGPHPSRSKPAGPRQASALHVPAGHGGYESAASRVRAPRS